jgi:hypothetical protein
MVVGRVGCSSTPSAARAIVLDGREGQSCAVVLADAAGLLAGIAGSYLLTRFLENLLFQVKTTDWHAYAGAVSLLAVVAVVAGWIPARRGARLDPAAALRQE